MNESAQQNASLLQELQMQGQQLKEQLESMQQAVTQITMTIESLQAIEKQTKEKIMIPLGSGCFLKGTSTEKENIIIDLGTNILAEKPIDKAVEIITGRKEELEKQITIVNNQLKNLDTKAREIINQSKKSN
ncbi:MAG: prefoldin subunit alpha [Candidatus Diapherotrites archaeon]|nr:prefoldin subunit alpha [Candidatus Diapherotrites archaeon]